MNLPSSRDVLRARRTTYFSKTRTGIDVLATVYVCFAGLSFVLALAAMGSQPAYAQQLAGPIAMAKNLAFGTMVVSITAALVVRSLLHRFVDLVDAAVEQRARFHAPD